MASGVSLAKRVIRAVLNNLGYEISRQAIGKFRWADISAMYPAPTVVFDVGAHVGETAHEVLHYFPKTQVHCFEPYSLAYNNLVSSLSPHPNILCRNCALGDSIGTAEFHVNNKEVTSSLLPSAAASEHFVSAGEMSSHSVLTVPVTTIDCYCETEGIKQVDVLKLDAQGYELRILQGARRTLAAGCVPLILTELNFVELYKEQANFEQVFGFLREQGYKLVSLYDAVRHRDQSIMWCDGLFILDRG
jgi:FkbM family methyltransferase